MAFVDLEKACDQVPRKIIWWVLSNWSRGWMPIRGAMSMFVRDTVKSLKWRFVFIKAFLLSLLLFIIVLGALSGEFRSMVPWEDLYADDLVITAKSFEEYIRGLLTWNEAIEEKGGLRVNTRKTKIMICNTCLDLLQSSGEFPCAVCRTGAGSNTIYCNDCKHFVHKKCNGLERFTEDPDYRCTRCQGTVRPLDGRQQGETWQAILLFIMQNRYLIQYDRKLLRIAFFIICLSQLFW